MVGIDLWLKNGMGSDLTSLACWFTDLQGDLEIFIGVKFRIGGVMGSPHPGKIYTIHSIQNDL